MFIGDALRDLCQWEAITFASPEAHARASARHRAYHERKAQEAHIIRAITLRLGRGVSWGDLSERERQIMRAYGAGADLPL